MLACSIMPPDDFAPARAAAPRRASRRAVLAGCATVMVAIPACGSVSHGAAASPDDLAEQWTGFRDRFVAPDGRVVDTGNGGISHSEGQGYAMLFAEAFDDRAGFERIFAWTRRNLRRPDGLHAWRWRPGVRHPVEDPNNATDGDLYIAWALLRAAERWNEPAWRQEAQGIGAAVLQRLVIETGGRTLLLPGASGFVHPERVVVNPSYYAFPALFALSRAVPDRAWQRVMGDGAALLRAARFGRWGLPADWVEVGRGAGGPQRPDQRADQAPRPAQGWPARFAFDAARVPLHLAWAGMADEPAVRAAATFWNDPGMPVRPAWTDLRNGTLAPYSAPAGIEAVAEVTIATGWRRGLARGLPTVARSPDYYSAALAILSRLALRENPLGVMAGSAPAPRRA
jgi:endoglucanase